MVENFPMIQGRVTGGALQPGESPSTTWVELEFESDRTGDKHRWRLSFGDAMYLMRTLHQMEREANFPGPPRS